MVISIYIFLFTNTLPSIHAKVFSNWGGYNLTLPKYVAKLFKKLNFLKSTTK